MKIRKYTRRPNGMSIEQLGEWLLLNGIKQPNGCVHFHKMSRQHGYGAVGFGLGIMKAHRVTFLFTNGSLPEEVCHKCDNPLCINPEHLFAGTHQDNMRDMSVKGRFGVTRGERSGMAKLTTANVLEIRQLYATGNYYQYEIGERFGVSRSCIKNIINKQRWAHI